MALMSPLCMGLSSPVAVMLMPGVDPVDPVLASSYRVVCDRLPSLDLNLVSGLVFQLDLRPDLSRWTCLMILTVS